LGVALVHEQIKGKYCCFPCGRLNKKRKIGRKWNRDFRKAS